MLSLLAQTTFAPVTVSDVVNIAIKILLPGAILVVVAAWMVVWFVRKRR
jgi:hypothetical protein